MRFFARRRRSAARPVVVPSLVEALERRTLMNATVWDSADGAQYGAGASPSAPIGEELNSSQTWSLNLSSVPAHTHAASANFDVTVTEHEQSSCCGGCCGGCSDGNDSFTFTLSVDGSSDQVTFGPALGTDHESDGSNTLYWAGVLLTQAPVTDTGNSITVTLTPSIPAGDSCHWYTWHVSSGSISIGTDVWVNSIQDGYRDGPQPAIVQFNRDGAASQPQTIFYTLGGAAKRGVSDGSGGYTPSDADYTGGDAVSGQPGYYQVTIPAGQPSAQVQFMPIVPYWFVESTPSPIAVNIVGDPNPSPTTIAYGAPNTATRPAASQPLVHGFKISGDVDGQMSKGAMDDDINNLDDDSFNVRFAAQQDLQTQLSDDPSYANLQYLRGALAGTDPGTDPEKYKDLQQVLTNVWGTGYALLSFAGNAVSVGAPPPPPGLSAGDFTYQITLGTDDEALCKMRFDQSEVLDPHQTSQIPGNQNAPLIILGPNAAALFKVQVTIKYYDKNGNELDVPPLNATIELQSLDA